MRRLVMISAHEACERLWFAGARHFRGPQKLLRTAGVLAFLDNLGDPLDRHAGAIHAVDGTGKKTPDARCDARPSIL